MTYNEAMADLNSATSVAVRKALQAVRAADNEDGAPVAALRLIRAKLAEIAADVDCLIDHGCTRAELADMVALYEGAKLAGLAGDQS